MKTLLVALLLALPFVAARADYGTDQTAYAAQGRYDLIEQQVEALQAKGPLRTRDQHALCFAYAKLKRHDRLMPCLDQLEAGVRKGDRRTRLFGLDDATPAVHLMRAEALIDLGDLNAARAQANEALIWLRKEQSDDHDMVVNAYALLAVAAAMQGEGALARQTVGLLKDFNVASDYKRAKAMALARAQMAVGAWAEVIATMASSEADFRFDAMLDRLLSGAAFSGRNNWVWVELPRAYMLHKAQLEVGRVDAARQGLDKLLAMPELRVHGELHWQVLLDRAVIAERDGDNALALRLYEQARQVIESQRRSVRSEASKIGFSSDKQAIYRGLVRTALKQNNTALAFQTAEHAKARALVDMLAQKADFGIYGNNAARVGELFKRFETLDIELGLQRPDATDQARQTLRNQWAQTMAELRDLAPQLASLLAPQALAPADVSRHLDADEALVGYFSADKAWYGYTLVAGQLRFFNLEGEGLEEDVRDFRDAVKRRRRAANELGDALFARLLKPMMTGLQGKNLVIVPQGSLHYLPFAALRQDGKFLIENRALRYLPSAALAGLLRSSDTSSIQRLLVLGNPDLNRPELDLPSAQQEAQSLHQKFPNRSELFVRRAASESLVKQRAAEFSHIHLASHGEFSSDNPLGSRLKLAADDRNDGMLTVSEIYSLPLRAHMVVLSACETGLGQITSGDDVIGLTRGFLYAGAKNVVGSLWEVDDEATSTLFQSMYELMAQGRSPKQALAQAQARLLKDKPHPFYWSAFFLSGSGS